MSRLTPFEVGQIKAHTHHELGPTAIAAIVVKEDGTHPSVQGVADVMSKLAAYPDWRGEREEGSGRPRMTSPLLDKQVVGEVFKKRGLKKVTVSYLKKKFVSLRKLSDGTIENRLHDAGLEYLRRRRKSIVTKKYLRPRLIYSYRVKRMHGSTLKKWAYSDGAAWYLDQSQHALEHSQRAALGSMVWRKTDRRDALFTDCTGPSSYHKCQGTPVKVWGVLAEGQLHVTILPEGQSMNRWWYAWIVEHYFPAWLGKCKVIAQDYG